MSKILDRIIKLIFALIALVNGIPNCVNVYLHFTLFTTLSRLLQKAGKVGHFGAVRFKDLGFQVAEKLEKEIDTYYPIYERIDPHHVAANLDLKRGWTGTPSLECMISCDLIVFARPASFLKALCRVLDNVNVNVSNPKWRLCYKGLLRGLICASETEV